MSNSQPTLTPHLVVNNASQAIEFYKKAFGATEICRLPAQDGQRIMHAQLQIGNSTLMLCDEFPEFGGDCRSAQSIGASPVTLHLYTDNVDALFQQAVDAGATVKMPLEDMFWGDRYGKVSDPFGHQWSLATHIKDVSPEEMKLAAQGACV